MGKPLRVLTVEDSEADAILLDRHLAAAGYDVTSVRVDTKKDLRAALKDGDWQIVLCDYTMPEFDAVRAHQVVQESGQDIPFIIISGTVGEEKAINALLGGAHDYIPKSNLSRLIPAIERELQQAENRRNQRRAEAALEASEAELRALFQAMNDVILVFDYNGRHIKVAPTNPVHTYARGTYRLGKTVHEIYPPDIADFILGNVRRSLDEARKLNVEYTLFIDGQDRWFDGTITPMSSDSVIWVARDITERKRAENERRVIFEIIEGSSSTPNLDEFLDLVHRSIGEIVYAENCFVMLHDPDTDTSRFEFWVDTRDPKPEAKPRGTGFASYVLRTGQPLKLTEEIKLELGRTGEAVVIGSPSVSWIGVPLRTPLRTIGVLVLQHYESENAFSDADLEFLSSVGDQIALAIERKRAEEALCESEDRYRDLVEHSHDLICTHDLNGQLLSVNQTAAGILGYDPDALLGRNIREILPSGSSEGFDDYIAEIQTNGIARGLVAPNTRNGERRIWEYVNTLRVEGVAVPIVRGVARDVTEQRQAEEALNKSEERYRELVENAIDIIYTQDLDGNYTSVNMAAERITGYTSEEARGKNMMQFVSPEFRERAKAMTAAKLAGEERSSYELEVIAKDGHAVQLEVNTRIVYDDGVAVGVQGIARDITERKRTDIALSESEIRYRHLFQANPHPMWVYNMDTLAFLAVNDAAVEQYGFSKDEFMSMTLRDIRPREDIPALIQSVEAAKLGTPRNMTWRHRKKDGTVIDVEVTGHQMEFEGRPAEVVMVDDITERKKAEAALEAAEEKYRSIFENAVEGIFQSSCTGHFISINPAMAQMLGYDTAAEMIADRTDIATQHYVDSNSRAELERALREDEIVVGFEAEVLCRDGSKIWTTESMRSVRDESGNLLFYEGSVSDITDRKQLEDQLRQSQKMEAVGTLAGGIAHDFNNLLTAINGYSDLTLKKMAADDPFRRNIEEVKSAGTRAADLTSQLLAFSRKQVLRPAVLNLNTVVSNIERMLCRIIRESIELRVVLDPDLGNIRADAGQIEQVIMNLAVNARDAMPRGGMLTIETKNVYLDEDYAGQHLGVSPGDFIRMTVTDTGEGMDAATRQHIFEPFFTTKAVGLGTGLGLSTVYGIVQQSGGNILVYTEVGHGTTFKIYLPCVDESIERPRWTGDHGLKFSGTETILVVEDEDIVRSLVREILTDNGYKVLEAAGGDEALKICTSYTEPIHLLLTDVIMPRIGGSELKASVVRLLPDIKALFMSGYTDDSVAHRSIAEEDVAFIEKPFTPDALARKIREVLEQ
jgi:two-component system cell cycle sensor histidine kinase/response regulator CckA